MRDLLRQRTRLVQQRTTHALNVKSTIARQTGASFSSTVILGEKAAPWPILSDPNVALAVEAHRPVIEVLNEQIARIEREVRRQLRPDPCYQLLQTVRGIGPVLAWMILLEAGGIHRFASVGNFASYCRCVQSRRCASCAAPGVPAFTYRSICAFCSGVSCGPYVHPVRAREQRAARLMRRRAFLSPK